MENKTTATFRQGDVLIVQLPDDFEMPSGEVVDRDANRVILAYGESTGHSHHILEPEVIMTRTANADTAVATRPAERFGWDVGNVSVKPIGIGGEGTYLSSPVPFTVRHEEHAFVELPAGKFQVIRQKEYEPKAVRYVAD